MNTFLTPLKPGARIAMVSPGGPVPERFKKQVAWGIEYLRDLGYEPHTEYLTDQEPFDAKQTADALTKAFLDPSIDAVLPACGGPHTYEILPYLNFKNLNPSKKLFCGMSDLSPVVNLLASKSASPAFYGTHLNFLHPKSSAPCNSYTTQSYWNMLCAKEGGKKKLDRNEKIHLFEYQSGKSQILQNIYAHPEYIQDETCRDVVFIPTPKDTTWEGTLFAFTSKSIRLLLEQGIDFDFSGKILLLDALEQTHTEILEDLIYIKNHSNIAQSTLIYFSSFVERSDKKKELPELTSTPAIQLFIEKAKNILAREDILYGFPSGHCHYRLTIPVGVRAQVNSRDGSITILDEIFT